MRDAILAVDPGREKCGLAVVHGTAVLARAVVARDDLGAALRSLGEKFTIAEVVVGNRTGADEAAAEARRDLPGLTVTLGDEASTTLEARRLYFADHPPRGWRRLVPAGLRVPPEPYDDYAAVIVARRRLAGHPPANAARGSGDEEESP